MIIKNNLRRLRNKEGWSQQDLAIAIANRAGGPSPGPSRISRWETGSPIGLPYAKKLAKVFNLGSVDELEDVEEQSSATRFVLDQHTEELIRSLSAALERAQAGEQGAIDEYKRLFAELKNEPEPVVGASSVPLSKRG
jgi:transcriptional regulator with XRE-family HTH domain